MKALIDHGANVNAEDSIGNTPLNLACISGRLPIVGVLLRSGASLSPTTSQTTPLIAALSRLQQLMTDQCSLSSPDMKSDILEVNDSIQFLPLFDR